MQPDSARSLFGSADGTPSAAGEQERPEGSLDCSSSLDEYIEDCGTREISCPKKATVTFYDLFDNSFHAVQTVCKTWSCTYCGPIKRAKLLVDVQAAKPNRFVTLTSCHNSKADPRAVYDETRRQISELVKQYRRDGIDFEYLRCLEVTETGFPHYHLLVRSPYLDQHELSHRWCHLTSAFIVDVRALTRDEKAARYVMKYLGKQQSVPFTNRRLSWSKNFFPKLPPQPESTTIAAKVTRKQGAIEQVVRWDYPHTQWEQLNRWHWISRSP